MLKRSMKFWGIVAAVFVLVYCLLLGIASAEPFQKTACSTSCETAQFAKHKRKKEYICWFVSLKDKREAVYGISTDKEVAKEGARRECEKWYGECRFFHCKPHKK
jgi:hypothetical protein